MRRFIAGAVCSECRALDRIVVEVTAEARLKRCVECGHTEVESSDTAAPQLPEPATRFTRRSVDANDIQPVRLLDSLGTPAPARRKVDPD